MIFPPLGILILWGLWVFQAIWCWLNVRRFYRRLRLQTGRSPFVGHLLKLPVVVIVPVKGVDDEFEQHVRGLFSQTHPMYRLVFVTESESEPAHVELRQLIDRLPRAAGLGRVDLLAAGLAEHEGQKVHNLRCGLATVDEDDGVVVFADADAVPGDDWLKAMAEAAIKKNYGAATGYRWFIPADSNWATHFASVINSSVATMLGPGYRNHAWGGSMAMTIPQMRECRLADYWQGALSDDYQLTRAVHHQKMRVYFMSRGMVASPVRFTWARLIEFARRQYLITRVYSPWAWWRVLAVLSLYVAGWVSAIVGLLAGWTWAIAAIGGVMVFDVLRAIKRRQIVKKLYGRETVQQMTAVFIMEAVATPLWMTLHWLLAASTLFGRRIRWAGITYLMRGRQDIVIESRDLTP
ncbi:glycosyltransferase [Planctomycetales bacterium ZRK34]|nr:glycosyltransferase [Planctomycetales bacterium ZRK34]